MKIKKIPHYLGLTLLTSGASLILGFLSFGGMIALSPIMPLAFAAFGLVVAYDGEVYLQNIKGSLKKFKHNYLTHHLAEDYLLNNIPLYINNDDCPQFFKDYKIARDLLDKFGNKRLDKTSRDSKKQIEQTLKDMENLFAKLLFRAKSNPGKDYTPFEQELIDWLKKYKQQDEWQIKIEKRRNLFNLFKAFSALSALFMSLGTTYLLMEAFSIIPMFTALATLPAIIVPMSVIAGIAYGLLTYNAITDMVNSNTLQKWFNVFREDRNVFKIIAAALLIALALSLTLCTAGTWWTVVKETPPLFAWMGRLPNFIMGIINPIINGLSSLIFNFQNTSESLELLDSAEVVDTTAVKPNIFSINNLSKSIKNLFSALEEKENKFQIFNPFRILLKTTITPLRAVLLLGHLVSGGVTSDRVPGVSKLFSALLGIISEGFEDMHYFVGHENDLDLPTRTLKFIFSPIYFLATCWDYGFSQLNSGERHKLSFSDAWEKQNGNESEESVTITNDDEKPSAQWQHTHAIYRISHHKDKHLLNAAVGEDVAQQKIRALNKLQQALLKLDPEDKKQIKAKLEEAANMPIYNIHRLFGSTQKTKTASFIGELPQRIGLQ